MSDPADIAFLILLAQNLAFGRTLPWSLLPCGLGRGIWLAATAGFLLLLASDRARSHVRYIRLACMESHAWIPLLCVANLALQLFNWKYFGRFGYGPPWVQAVACTGGALLLRRGNLAGACALSLALLAGSILSFPLDPLRSDMLPVIERALGAWLREGQNPYGAVVLANGPNQMPYLPVTFLSHLPAFIAGLDLRWGQLAIRAAWFALLLRSAREMTGEGRGVLQLFVLNPYWNFRHDLYFEIFFLLIAVYHLLPRARWLAMPAMLLTRQWAWVLFPFHLVVEARRESAPRALLKAGAATAAGALLVAAVFHGRATLLDVLHASLAFGDRVDWAMFPGDYGLTLAPLAFALHATHVLVPLQVGFVTGLWIRALRHPARAEWLAGCALAAFLVLNAHFWLYFWLTPALWLALDQRSAGLKPGNRPDQQAS